MRYLIIGFGQDAILMARWLNSIGSEYRVLIRRSSEISKKVDSSNIDPSKIVYSGEIDEFSLLMLYEQFHYTHVFNFAANSFVQDSGLRFFEFIQNNSKILWSLMRVSELTDGFWIFHPLSSEILDHEAFGSRREILLKPRNAYGLAKSNDLLSCNIYRELTSGKINSCILFNHESSLRAAQFFTKKVSNYFNNSKNNEPLKIFNAKSQRDWGCANEFVRLIHHSSMVSFDGLSMLGTGNLMSVEEYIDFCFKCLDEDFEKQEVNGLITWKSQRFKVVECKRDVRDEERVLKADPELVTPAFGEMPQIMGYKLIQGLLSGEL